MIVSLILSYTLPQALNLMGKEVGGYRLPLYPMAEENRQKLINEMKKAGLL